MDQGPLKRILLFFFIFHIFLAQAQDEPFLRISAEDDSEMVVPGIIIFKLKPGADLYEKSALSGGEPVGKSLEPFGAGFPHRVFPMHQPPVAEKSLSGNQPLVDLSRIFQIRISHHELLHEAINRLYATGMVEYAQPRYVPSVFWTPNDPMIGSQYYLEKIRAFEAWEICRGDTTVVIGITDTGIDLKHPDLIGAIKYNYNDTINGEDSDNDGYIDNFHGWNLGENNNNPQFTSGHGHGIHVSGIAAATANNGTGIAGTGYHSRLLPVKISDELGRLVMAYEGIVYAADQGAKVINCSWGGSIGAGRFGQDIINYAVLNRDAIVIAAAGNSNNQVPLYPASYENVLSVAATNAQDVKWEGSSYGIYVDVSAPGFNMLSTWANGTYITSSGTSMAAPAVAGAAAIVRSHFPHYSALQIMAQLKVTADNIDNIPGNNNFKGLLGSGRINLYRALTETNQPYIRLNRHLNSAEEFAALQPGDEFSLRSWFQNLLAPAQNIQARLTSESPYVSIIQPQVSLGSINTLQEVSNLQPFGIRLLESLPASQPVEFTITFTNEQGEYAGREHFSILFNVDYVNIQFNDLATTITSKGTMGYNYPNHNQGIGLVYNNGVSLIRNAGLIIGTSSSKVVDNVYGATEGSFNQFFVPLRNARVQEEPEFGDLQVSGQFTDANAGVFNMDLKVDYSAYFWQQAPHRKYVILEYRIINQSLTNYSSLYAGFFSDWYLRDNKNHRAGFDDQTRMGYSWSAGGGHFAGISLLSPGNIRHYAFDNTGFNSSIKISDGFTSSEKYTALRTDRNSAGVYDADNDISTLVSSGPFFLASRDTLTIAFAIIAGDHLSDLKTSASHARVKYSLIDQKPTVSRPPLVNSGQLMVYPNPAANILRVRINPGAPQLVSIVDLKGKTLLKHTIAQGHEQPLEVEFDISGLQPGTYLVKCAGEGFVHSSYFIRL